MPEQEAAQLRDYIIFLEGEVAQLSAENADLRDQIDSINQLGGENDV